MSHPEESNTATKQTYGQLDASYKAAGKLDGIRRLVDSFYDYMDNLEEAKIIKAMHTNDLTVTKDKLTCFLSGWLGGPRLYSEKYGSISIPMIHKHLSVASADRDAWLLCMKHAANDQPYNEIFKKYLLEQLFVPAERIRQVSQ
jgi:hemoglobin